jgi:acyl-coenzyme A synthetase/AMP-(fatty) acid ligase
MGLAGLLDDLPGDRALLRRGERVLAVAQFRARVAEKRETARRLGVARCTLACADPLEAILWMLALDATASAVFLAPENVRQGPDYDALAAMAGSTLTIADAAGPVASVAAGSAGGAPVVTQWLLATSGTTGTPKLIAHTADSLARTVKTDPARGRDFRWALVYDPFRFAGLQVVLQSLAAGSSLLLCHDAPFPEQLAAIRAGDVNALSATPTFWRKALMHGGLAGHAFRQITLGGEAADQFVLDALKRNFPGARIAHVYASTEAGVGFSVADGMEGFPDSYLRDGVHGNSLRIGAAGTLEIAVAGQGARTASGAALAGADGYVDTGDLVERKGERVVFRGRLSGTINVGGHKVVPEEVERVIRGVPGVAETLVKAKGSAMIGQLVVAEIVAQADVTDSDALKRRVLEACRSALDRYQVPAMVRVVDQLAQSATGKLLRN